MKRIKVFHLSAQPTAKEKYTIDELVERRINEWLESTGIEDVSFTVSMDTTAMYHKAFIVASYTPVAGSVEASSEKQSEPQTQTEETLAEPPRTKRPYTRRNA